MDHDLLPIGQSNLRGRDSNSLLRLYDAAAAIAATSPSRQQRARADKLVRRLAKELQRRKVPLGSAPAPPQAILDHPTPSRS